MNVRKVLSRSFLILAIILSDIMCAVVAAQYTNMLWEIQYKGFSAPASTAFFYAIPFVAGIAICLILFWVLRRREKS